MATKKKAKTAAKSTTAEPVKKLSLMKAAIAVLESSEEAMTTKQLVEAAKAKGLWEPGSGKTPEQTLYSAFAREIKTKGPQARFKLITRGHFALNKAEA